jgi:hypothetical protein
MPWRSRWNEGCQGYDWQGEKGTCAKGGEGQMEEQIAAFTKRFRISASIGADLGGGMAVVTIGTLDHQEKGER